MSTNEKRNSDDQQIDLFLISAKIGEFFQGINTMIFKAIQFVLKHIVILGILFVIGVGLGMYFDKTNKVYDHEIIVQPNFESTDYLYAKVALLTSKIKQRDSVFLKAIGIKNPSKLVKIDIAPVIDIYKFINSGDKDRNVLNFELLKLMADDGDLKKIVEEKMTSKNYAFHLISFTTNKPINLKEIIDPLMAYFNNSVYFEQMKSVYIKNAETKILRNNEIIAQIDGFLNDYGKSEASAKSDKLIYYNENTQLNAVIQTKNELISENGGLRLGLVGTDKIIKTNSTTINLLNTKSINGKLKLILPILFIGLYLLASIFISFYKTQAAKNK
ncbi:hypothetical protein [Flavobacterium sp.]|uniref:hypothetical protein n=1 Tax=Flavobacterium sp. TaxID=239 RepID=UPI0026342983|nr:hypothetical protein [Flavobacterium sp.]